MAIPGNFPLPHERPTGCNFGPRCDYFESGRCNAQDIPMFEVPDEDRHETRCLRYEEIDWNAPIAASQTTEKATVGDVVLRVDNLKKYYEVAANAMFGGGDRKVVKANETISFEARESETLAIVGESGCGKSTLAKVLMGLETATDGHVFLDNTAIGDTAIEDRETATISSIQMVFQNPFDTLNPSMTVGRQIIRALEVFGIGENDEARRKRMLELLDLVKLPRAFAERMPRQLSGGQKQRVGIARAFAGGARIVVADEPVSALDVSVQAAVTDLLMEIQRVEKTTLLFISHDLSIVRYLSDRCHGHVSRPRGRDRLDRSGLLAALPPLYRGVAFGGAHRRHQGAQAAYRAGGGHPLGDEPANRLPLPDALPLEEGRAGQSLRDRGAADAHAGRGSPGQVPPGGRHPEPDGAGHRDRRCPVGTHRASAGNTRPLPPRTEVGRVAAGGRNQGYGPSA